MFKFYFKEFDFRGFKDFIFDLVDIYNFWGIEFYPDNVKLFSKDQLTHAAPGRNLKHRKGFIWAWMQKQDEVRYVRFEFWAKDGSAKIEMNIDLDKKYISLDKLEGILSAIQIEEILKSNMNLKDKNIINWQLKMFNFIKKYIIKIIIGLIITIVASYIIYRLGWN